MKRKAKSRLIVCSLGLAFVIMFLVGNTIGYAQDSTYTPTPIITLPPPTDLPPVNPQSISITSTPELDSVTYREMLATYKEVLSTTQWITTLFLGLLSVSGIGALYIYQRGLSGISDLRLALDKFKQELENLAIQNQELVNRNLKLDENLHKQQSGVENIHKDIDSIKTNIRSTQRDFESRVPRLETLADVDTYTMRLFGTNEGSRKIAKRKLIEYSKDRDPVVRRECIRSFEAMPDYPEYFIDIQDPIILVRLKEMAASDPERGVRLEASNALKKFLEI